MKGTIAVVKYFPDITLYILHHIANRTSSSVPNSTKQNKRFLYPGELKHAGLQSPCNERDVK